MTAVPDAAAADQARQVADAILYEGYLLYRMAFRDRSGSSSVCDVPRYAQVTERQPARPSASWSARPARSSLLTVSRRTDGRRGPAEVSPSGGGTQNPRGGC